MTTSGGSRCVKLFAAIGRWHVSLRPDVRRACRRQRCPMHFERPESSRNQFHRCFGRLHLEQFFCRTHLDQNESGSSACRCHFGRPKPLSSDSRAFFDAHHACGKGPRLVSGTQTMFGISTSGPMANHCWADFLLGACWTSSVVLAALPNVFGACQKQCVVFPSRIDRFETSVQRFREDAGCLERCGVRGQQDCGRLRIGRRRTRYRFLCLRSTRPSSLLFGLLPQFRGLFEQGLGLRF